jgi:surface carbohydrate biosynthesis protein
MKDADRKRPLIIPVENQVRELDPKLLLACVAAERGFATIIGSHREIDFQIASFPRGLYLCKSMTGRNLKMFKIIGTLGHWILSWDEEALVHLPAETYYSRRMDLEAIRYVSDLFAWGEDNAQLWRQYPGIPGNIPIHVTGNPRTDMLRPEIRIFYEDEVKAIRETYGDYILVNTNFNHVNAFFPAQNLFQPVRKPGKPAKFGKAAVGMTREYAEGLREHKQHIFEAFQEMIPALERTFPSCAIVVRPHPTESQEVYKRIAAQCSRVKVTNEGNVVPWLMATKAVVHNGCTTGVEAFVMRVPAISYRARVNENYDDGFYRLPNLVSHQCFSLEELKDSLKAILTGQIGPAEGDQRRKILNRYLAAQDGPLACERVMDVLEGIAARGDQLRPFGVRDRLSGWALASGRRMIKRFKSYIPGTHAPPEFHRHRYPGISLTELTERVERLQRLLNPHTTLRVRQVDEQIFELQPA